MGHNGSIPSPTRKRRHALRPCSIAIHHPRNRYWRERMEKISWNRYCRSPIDVLHQFITAHNLIFTLMLRVWWTLSVGGDDVHVGVRVGGMSGVLCGYCCYHGGSALLLAVKLAIMPRRTFIKMK